MRNRKIGIMTFHRSHNCGSMLQAFALQKILQEKYQMQAEIIDFSNKAQQNYYAVLNPRPGVKRFAKNLLYLPYYRLLKKYRNDYEAFIEQYFCLSDSFYEAAEDMAGVEEQYGLVIAGSDQIWNIKCVDADKAYFLNFVHNTPKAAYAASLGAMSIRKYANNPEEYTKLLEEFQMISIREPNGKMWVEELIKRPVPITLDPTLLFTGEEWEQHFDLDDVQGEYIFYYAFTYKKQSNQVVREISKRLGMPVIVIDARAWAFHHLAGYGFRLYEKGGPLALLSLMKNASLVITASFHGTAFATLFKRPFWAFKSSAIKNPDDDRAISLLRQLGLADRYRFISELLEVDLMKPIDYDAVSGRIDSAKSVSFRFLEETVGLTGGVT